MLQHGGVVVLFPLRCILDLQIDPRLVAPGCLPDASEIRADQRRSRRLVYTSQESGVFLRAWPVCPSRVALAATPDRWKDLLRRW